MNFKFSEQHQSFRVSFIIGIVFTSLGLIFTLIGWSGLGAAFFFFLPLAIGISSGLLPEPKQALKGTFVSMAIFSVFLLLTKIEGIICVILAMPILMGAIFLGWWLGRLFGKNRYDNKTNIKATLAPFFIFIVANFFEVFSGGAMMPAEVVTSIELDASPSEVYQAIIAVDTVDVEKHFLQKLGLPTPRKCTLTEEKVGGLRICKFEEGEIIETIKELKKDTLLRMDVTTCNLGNRSWLKFNEDIYNFESIGNSKTKITRTTTYFSNLKPRKYWELMEQLTIAAEQDFVFRNLKKDIALIK